MTERRLVRIVVVATLVGLFVVGRSDVRLAYVAWSAVLGAVVFVPEFIRPGVWGEWMYDHPVGSTIGVVVALGGMGLTSAGRGGAVLLALMGLVLVVVGRGRLERRIEQERREAAGGSQEAI